MKSSWIAVEFESAVADCTSPTGGTEQREKDTLSGIHLQVKGVRKVDMALGRDKLTLRIGRRSSFAFVVPFP